MIHAQQKGYTPPEVLRGLCNAVARNFRTAVVRSHPVVPPVVFVGGVAANAAVVQAMRETFELDESELTVPPAFSHLSAIGAAVAAGQSDGRALDHLTDLKHTSDTEHGTFPRTAPLGMDNVLLLRDRVGQYVHEGNGEAIDAYMGIDIGSVSTNVVIIDAAGEVVTEIYTRTRGRPIEVVGEALEQIDAEWGPRLDIRGVGTTGSGRELVGELIGADTINDEITAHKTGATYVGNTLLDGRLPDTIFEIGGQDSKYICLEKGIVVDFTMNEACAAGTGSFLEERAEELDIAIKDEFAQLALSSPAPIRLGERCTVFMERDVNSYVQRGADKPDLVAGLAYSVVYNYINRVVRGRKIGDCIFFQGGTAYNDSVAAAFAAVTGKQIIVPPHNGVIGAIGAALLARDKMATLTQRSRRVEDIEAGVVGALEEAQLADELDQPPASSFRGYDLAQVDYALREFMCKGCSNACQIQEFDVEGNKTYWGDKCSDRFRKQAKTNRKPVIDDLFAMREQWLLDESHLPTPDAGAPTVGIPLTMFAWDQLPFWRTMLAHAGFKTVLSDQTNKKIIQSGLDSVVAEPCFPIIVAHGHIAQLHETGVDRILAPNIVSVETPQNDNNAFLCPWHQTLPFVCRRAPALREAGKSFISPTVRFQEGQRAVAGQLRECFKEFGIGSRGLSDAVAAGYRAQQSFGQRLHEAGRQAMAKLDESDEVGIVLIGRPYNIHDPGVNLSVPRKLRDYYGVNCLPIDALDIAGADVRDVNPNMYWELGRRIIAVAKLVGENPNLHIIYITNFKCGPDSFIKHFVGAASGKPFLTLQFDGHSNDAGVVTRCEAYLDSKGILRPWRAEEQVSLSV
jgi:predicted CoA-substrate-specific enzyme activase